MRVLLAYPPDRSLPTAPFASLPVLAADLRRAGHAVVMADINCQLLRLLLEPRWLDRCRVMAERTLDRSAGVGVGVAAGDRWRETLAMLALEVIGRVPAAAALMCSEACYEPAAWNRGFDDLRAFLRLVFARRPALGAVGGTGAASALADVLGVEGDPVGEAYEEVLVDRLLATAPDIVGFSVPFQDQWLEVLHLAALLKRRRPALPVVVGGQAVTLHARRLLDGPAFDSIDYAILGEGESPLRALLEMLRGGTAPSAVPGLVWRDGREVRHSPTPAPLLDLNSLPPPDYDGIGFDGYLAPERCVSLQTSRGCYYGRCAFCSEAWRDNVRMRSPELVYGDLQHIRQRHGVRRFLLWDSLTPVRTMDHVARRIGEDGSDITWFAQTKFDRPLTDPARVDRLARGGCRFLLFGLESANERVLQLMDKGNDLGLIERVLAAMRAAGIQAGVNWFSGFPGETAVESQRTFDFIADHADSIALSAYIGRYLLEPGTHVFTDPARYGIEIVEVPGGGFDYRNADGSPRVDDPVQHLRFEARTDVPLVQSTACLLFATHRPAALRHIRGLGRFGRTWGAPQSMAASGLLWRTDGQVVIQARDSVVGQLLGSGTTLELDGLDLAILTSATGLSLPAMAGRLQPVGTEELEGRVRRLLDHGFLRVDAAAPLHHRQAQNISV